MQQVLYAQGLGYYVAGARKFGAEGDFVTAPEISSLFSHCLAHYICELSEEALSLLELGAGSGQMALDILRYFIEHKVRLSHYFILEISPDLKARQKTLLQQRLPEEWFRRIQWLDELPHDFEGIILANEVLDALPVERFIKLEQGVAELGVCVEEGSFRDCLLAAPDPALIDTLNSLESELGIEFPMGYVSEVCLRLPSFLNSLSDCLTSGHMIFIDYGFLAPEYYHPQRDRGTLQCYYRHHVHDDPYVYPGLQDITASVDFSAVMQHAEQLGLEVSLYQSQSYFLIENGLLQLAQAQIEQQNDVHQLKISQQIQKLTDPHQMGERVKVVVLSREKIS